MAWALSTREVHVLRVIGGMLLQCSRRLCFQTSRNTCGVTRFKQHTVTNRALSCCVSMGATAVDSAQSTHVAKDYEELTEKLQDISSLEGCAGLLTWDELVMMPEGAAAARAKQKSALTGVLYDKQTDVDLGDILKRLSAETPHLDPWQAANVREANRDYSRLVSVPKALAKRRSELESQGYQAWAKARAASDFSQFAPVLQEWVELVKQICGAIDPERPTYEVMLEEFEKGMTTTRLDEIFSQVRDGLVPLLQAIRERGTAPDTGVLGGDFDVAKQAELCDGIARQLGFDLAKGRLDVSVHPFTGGCHPTDVRMTTRFKPHDFTEGLTGAIHETGHALYEQGRSLEHDGLPVSKAMSMGIHESQSLLWERMVGLSRPFAGFLLPRLTDAFPQLPRELSADALYRALNAITVPSMIRTEADEVTYPLHIILRYELERGLLEGSVSVEELPGLWRERMTAYLGCTPEDDARGVLQDVHWSAGAFAYFPTYTLGAMYACQLFQAAKKQLPSLEEDIARGEFAGLKTWLNEHVHEQGSFHPSGDALMEAVTGSPLDPSIYLDYLKQKYTALYQL